MLTRGAAAAWLVSTVLGFEQFGLPTVLFGLALAYSGSIFYAWRSWTDRRDAGTSRRIVRSLHFKLTGAMLAVLALDGAGYALAIASVPSNDGALVSERSGLIAQIDRWVIAEACRMLGDSQRAGHDLHFEVNLSGLSMGDPELLALIERARNFAEHLATLGCAFALDDFGAGYGYGYGSFYYLKPCRSTISRSTASSSAASERATRTRSSPAPWSRSRSSSASRPWRNSSKTKPPCKHSTNSASTSRRVTT